MCYIISFPLFSGIDFDTLIFNRRRSTRGISFLEKLDGATDKCWCSDPTLGPMIVCSNDQRYPKENFNTRIDKRKFRTIPSFRIKLSRLRSQG